MPKLIAVATALLALVVAASAAPAPDANDGILPISEIRKGMKGYGLTVFEGGTIETFDVVIEGVLHNIGPQQDLILARVDSAVIRRAGVIAGMSGSPIFIDGKVIGALAYSWQFAKDPIAGITPIEEMLRLAHQPQSGGTKPAGGSISSRELLEVVVRREPQPLFDKLMASFASRTTLASVGALPIATPLSFSRFAPETIERFAGILEARGFVPVPTGSSGSSGTSNVNAATPFRAGDAVGAVLVDGDFSLAATGTVTHVDGSRVYGFGHPFLDIGEIEFPMAKSEIVTVMASLARSFKFSNTGDIVGTLKQDRSAGIYGILGETAEMIPIEITMNGSTGAQTYRLRAVRHHQLFPLIMALATDSVVSAAQRSSGERTILLDSEIKLHGFPPIRLRDGWAGPQARQAIPAYLAVVASYLLSNEFRDASIETVKIHLHHDDRVKIAKLVEASVESPADGAINPGDTVRVRTVLKPFRGESFVESFDVQVPENQAAGNAYLFIGSGTAVNQLEFYLVPPDPRTLEQVIRVVERLRPSTDLTVGLYSSSEGAVMAGVYLPNLPPTIQAIVSGDTTNSAQAPVKYHAPAHLVKALDYIVDGALKIDLEIKPKL